jgi:glycine cleavage system H protein
VVQSRRGDVANQGGDMSDETYPMDLRYFKKHDWVRVEGDEAVLGVTWFAQHALHRVVYIELPAVGDRVTGGQPYGELESVKSVSEVFSPVTGAIVATNGALLDVPEHVNRDCYGEGWLIRVRLDDAAEIDGLMDADGYQAFLAQA